MSYYCSSCLWGGTFLSWLASVVLRRSMPVQPLLLRLHIPHGLGTFGARKLRWSQDADSAPSQMLDTSVVATKNCGPTQQTVQHLAQCLGGPSVPFLPLMCLHVIVL